MLRPRNMLILLVLLPWASGMQAQAAATDPNEALQALQFQNEKPSAWQFEREDSWALKFENDDFSALQFEDDGRPWYCKTEDSAVARAKAIRRRIQSGEPKLRWGIAAAITKQVDCG